MSKQVITDGVSIGPYSPAVVAGDFCYLSGQGGLDPETGILVEGGIQAETHRTLQNVQQLLGRAGFALEDVVSVTCFLKRMEEWPAMNEVYATYFTDAPPARAAVEVSDLPAGVSLEVSCVAYRAQKI